MLPVKPDLLAGGERPIPLGIDVREVREHFSGDIRGGQNAPTLIVVPAVDRSFDHIPTLAIETKSRRLLDQSVRQVSWPAVGRVVERVAGTLRCLVVPLDAELTHASFVEAERVTNLVAHGLDDLRT